MSDFFLIVKKILFYFRRGYGNLFSMTWPNFIGVFWGVIFLEFPRYLLSDVYVLFKKVIQKGTGYESVLRDRRSRLMENSPLVSVIVPALNEDTTISQTVHSIREQSYPNIETIIVNDGSTDNTDEICKSMQKKGWIRYVSYDRRQGKSPALNYGLNVAHGDYIVFMDSDCILERDAILNILARLQDDDVGAVSGDIRVRNVYENFLTCLQAVEYLESITVGRIFRSDMGILPIVSGAFGAFERDLIERVGGHEPGPGNDSDLTIRIRKLRKKIEFAPDATALTDVPTNVSGLVKQRMRWNRNIIRNRVRKHRDTFNWNLSSFDLLNFLSFADTIFFTGILSILWLFYMVNVIVVWPSMFPIVYASVYLLLYFSRNIQLTIALSVGKRVFNLVPLYLALPLFAPFKIFLRLVRLVAFSQELLFWSSYKDPFAPKRVQDQIDKL